MLKIIKLSKLALKNKLFYRDNVRTFASAVIETTVSNYLSPKDTTKPPYHHVCQVGDPVLRAQSEPVDPEIILTPVFQGFLKQLTDVMRHYGAYGMAAPQIGVPSQIFVIETTKQQYEINRESGHIGQPVEVVPHQVFINPKMKILDYNTITYPESCASLCGYGAFVPRPKKVQIEALDSAGQPFVWEGEGWAAKLAQHELDHLHGKMYIDKMDPKTFVCTVWDTVNRKSGNVSINFCPQKKSKLKRFFFFLN